MFDIIIVRYGEIGLKSEVVRRRFEDKLIKNIIFAFDTEKIHAQIERKRGRIFIRSKDLEKTIKVLKKIFGIVSVSSAKETYADIKDIKFEALEMARKRFRKIKTFAVRVSRSGKHDFTSQDVAIEVGREIKENLNLSVNLDNPDMELCVEVRDDKAYIFFEKIAGPSGLPLGTQGKVLSIIKSKKDLLALWYMFKRGCSAKILSYGMDEEIRKFLRVWYAEKDAEIVREKNIKRLAKDCLAIVVGETMDDTDFKIDRSLNMPVLRPLITFTNREINDRMREIGL